MEYLERAIQRAEGWVAESANDHPDRARRLDILDKMTARIHERRNMLDDIGLPSDGTQRSVAISLEFIPSRSLEYFRQKLGHKTNRQVRPRFLNGGGSITEV
jgi:FixJ family two-component response regulator